MAITNTKSDKESQAHPYSAPLMSSPLLTGILTLALMHTEVLAHHNTSIYDREAPVTIEGEIARYEWSNPHVYLYVEEETAAGELITWEIEAQPPSILRRLGWTRETVKPGDRVIVQGLAARDRAKQIALMHSLQLSDDNILSISSANVMASLAQDNAASSLKTASLAGTWTTVLNLDAIGPFLSPTSVDVTEKGRDALAGFVEAEHSPALACIPFPAPQLMVTPDIKHIEVRDAMVIISSEFDAAERRIYLNSNSHEDAVDTIQGHTIGRWEDGALVMDTTHFTPHRSGIAGGLPSGPGKHLVERLELNAEGSHLIYSFELRDPEYLAAPIVGGGVQWSYRPDLEYQAVACSIDNARRFAE